MFGAGENGFIAYKLLKERGIRIQGFIDNNSKIIGNVFCGCEINYLDKIKNLDGFYPIICVNEKNIGGVRLQLMANNIYEYSIFFRNTGYSFNSVNKKIFETILKGINIICFENEADSTALPYIGYALGKDGSQLGNINWLLKSTSWTHPGYGWIEDFLSKKDTANILEIGPGYGLMSYVFLELHNKTKVDWIIFGDKDKKDLDPTCGYEKGLNKVKSSFGSGRVKCKFGRIEFDDIWPQKKYDLIIMTEVFEHFALNPVETMTNIKKLLNDDGRMLLTTPNWGHLPTFRTWKELPYRDTVTEDRYLELTKCGHVYQYTKDEMEEILKLSGFDVSKYELSESNNHNFFLC